MIKAPKVRPFNLSLENQGENDRIVMALQGLQANAGWVFLMQLFEENKKILAEMIISKEDIDGKPLSEEMADEARYKYGYLKELMNKPEEYIEKLRPKKTTENDLDPYDKGKQN